MLRALENRGGIQRNETGAEFNARAQRVLTEAVALSNHASGGYSEVNRWISIAKSRDMAWMEGLYSSEDRMREASGKKSPNTICFQSCLRAIR
jgi:hypothetical protein